MHTPARHIPRRPHTSFPPCHTKCTRATAPSQKPDFWAQNQAGNIDGSHTGHYIPQFIPKSDAKRANPTLDDASHLQTPVLHEVTWSPALQPLFLASPRRNTRSAQPRGRGCPSLRSQELMTQQHNRSKGLMDALGTADGKQEEPVPARCLVEQEGCEQPEL